MGSGKSTVGAVLAELLGYRFLDLDSEIEKHAGRSIPEIFQAEGEPRFRQIEREVLEQIVGSGGEPAVLALGGGTFIQAANRELLLDRHAITVYLEADFDLLFSRCCNEDGGRPLMLDPERSRKLFEERQPTYRLANAVIQVAGRTPPEIASEIASILGRQARPAVSD